MRASKTSFGKPHCNGNCVTQRCLIGSRCRKVKTVRNKINFLIDNGY